MSYILDALRRADAERGRGGVPGLHTQATPVPGALPAQRSSASASLVVVVAAVLVVAALTAGGTWWAMQRNAPSGGVVLAGAQMPANTPAMSATPAASATPSVPAAASPAAQTGAPAVGAVNAPVAPVAPATANAFPAVAAVTIPPPAAERRTAPPPREKPAPSVATPRATAADVARNRAVDEAPRERTPAPAINPPAARTQEPAATPAPTGTVFAQSDLPDAVRAQLPVLKISGATYSANPLHRMAIVNGQVLHEGDVAAPGLLLEKIEPTRTIWSFKGYRYGLASQ